VTENNNKRLHAKIEGRVQGVGFRYFVQRKAVEFQLVGWVKNMWDRSVELVAEGDEGSLDNLLAAIHRGPTGSNVTNVEFSWKEYKGEFETFKVKWV
jgi:acylphosphatase